MSDLPQGWEWASLGEIATSVKNGIFVSRPGETPNGVPILRISSVRPMRLDLSDLRYSGSTPDELAQKDALLQAGDLLFTRYSGSREFVGSCARVPDSIGDITYPDKLIRARTTGVDSRYLAAAFASPLVRSEVEKVLRTTAGQVGISGSDLRSVRVPVAPVAEQRRIVAALEDLLSRLMAADRYVASSAAKLADMRASTLAQYHRDSIKHGARLVAIADLAETQLGKMLDSKKRAGIQTAYLRNINVRWHSLNLESLMTVALTEAERTKFSLKYGDVLVCEGGEPGRCAVWHDQTAGVAFQKALHRVRVRSSVSPEWLCMMLDAEVRGGRVEALLTGSTIKHLPQEKLRSIRIPVPEVDLQRALVREFSSMSDGTRYTDNELIVSATRSDTLRQQLLADAFAGRLIPQDPTDEPASVLLDRIRAERAAQPRPPRRRRTAQ